MICLLRFINPVTCPLGINLTLSSPTLASGQAGYQTSGPRVLGVDRSGGYVIFIWQSQFVLPLNNKICHKVEIDVTCRLLLSLASPAGCQGFLYENKHKTKHILKLQSLPVYFPKFTNTRQYVTSSHQFSSTDLIETKAVLVTSRFKSQSLDLISPIYSNHNNHIPFHI